MASSPAWQEAGSPASDATLGGGRGRLLSLASTSRSEKLTVLQAVEEALAQNRTVLQARLAVDIGASRAEESRAQLYPGLRVRGNYTRRNEAPLAVAPELGTSFSVGPREVLGLEVVGSYSIYGFGRHLHAYRAARLSEQRLDADRRAVEGDIAAAVTAAAYDLLEGTEGVAVARDNEEALLRQVADAQALLDAGRVTRADVLEAEVEYDRSRRQRERIESAIPILRMTLNRILGRPTEMSTRIAAAPAVVAPLWPEERLMESATERVMDEALAARPELQAASLEIEALERSYRAAVARELPELTGTLTYTNSNSPFTTPSDAVILGLSLDIPVFTGGARGARIRRAKRELESARIRKAEAESEVRLEVADALRNVLESYRDIAVSGRAIERSEESLRIQREKFASGRATSREVLDSTALLSRARLDSLTSRFDYEVAVSRLHRARGADPLASPRPNSGSDVGGTAAPASASASVPASEPDSRDTSDTSDSSDSSDRESSATAPEGDEVEGEADDAE